MAKKFVRGITDIKTISNQDLDTNNVNDLLSDGKHNYIHRKKQNGSEEYHNLTDNIKTIQSDNTDLLSVTNYNNTTNSATIRPKHDAQKEQLLESTDNTIVISHGGNGTEETTSVDVNPEIVLEHNNLLTSYGLTKTSSGNTTTLSFEYTKVDDGYDLNHLTTGNIRGVSLLNAPSEEAGEWYLVSSISTPSIIIQNACTIKNATLFKYSRIKSANVWSQWAEEVCDKSVIDTQLAQKQNTLTSNTSIGISGTGLMQLYSYQMSYTTTSQGSFEGSLNTYAKTVKKDTSLTANPKLEYHFTAELYEGKTSITIALNENDTTYFEYILTKYNRTAMINGFVFSLSGSNLTISRDSSTYNQVVSFSDIIDPSVSVQSSNQEQETE